MRVAIAMGLVLASTLAAAPSSAHPSQAVTLRVAAPTPGATVHDTTEVTFTGLNLAAVKLFRLGHLVATAVVNADGTAATARLDTARFDDGPLLLTAFAWGAGSSLPRAFKPVLVRVDNVGTDHHPAGYDDVVFSDEFSGAGLDRGRWCTRFQYDGGTESAEQQATIDPDCLGRDPVTGATLGTLDTLGGNGMSQGQESQVYRDVNAPGETMHTIDAGVLSLHATATRLDQPFLKYESAMLRSKREFQPTTDHPLYLTARVKLPDVIGSWPAFWLNGAYGDGHIRPPWPPEIDIFEGVYNGVGNNANMLWTALQTWPYSWEDAPQGPVVDTYAHPQFADNSFVATSSLRDVWLEIGLEWHADHVCWYLDGLKFRCSNYTWVSSEGPADTNPAAIMLNLAVGGPWAGANGVDLTRFPMTYDIDHVRVYRH